MGVIRKEGLWAILVYKKILSEFMIQGPYGIAFATVCVYIYININVYMYVYMYIYIYAYIYSGPESPVVRNLEDPRPSAQMPWPRWEVWARHADQKFRTSDECSLDLSEKKIQHPIDVLRQREE